ncbi:peptidase inhibitor family I36 protein [Nocardiopsis alba]|uniref:peptidase inhibitor family I36 protein n=1 Tax=Nocardiopsis alba TaxID=53437 RepID=UPI0036633149
MFRSSRIVLALGLATALATSTTTAHAETVPEAVQEGQAGGGAVGALALHEGELIDLAEDWGEAEVCIQQDEDAAVEFRCYDDDVSAAAGEGVGTADLRDCLVGTLCLWENTHFTGKRVQFQRAGTYNMADYHGGFRDKISSFHNDRNAGMTLVDFRSGIIADRKIDYLGKTVVANLGSVAYPDGGSWDNKTDRVIVK